MLLRLFLYDIRKKLYFIRKNPILFLYATSVWLMQLILLHRARIFDRFY